MTDGLLEVAVVTAAGGWEWASLIVDAVRHRQHVSGQAHLATGREIDVRLAGKHRYELDGGMKGRSARLVATAQPHSLTICAPLPTG